MSLTDPEDLRWPKRSEVDRTWSLLLDGGVGRREVSEWAARWVERASSRSSDPLVSLGLTYLHGFDLIDVGDGKVRHGGGDGEYVKPSEQIRDDYDYWRSSCQAFDADPALWWAGRNAAVEAELRRHRMGLNGSDEPT